MNQLFVALTILTFISLSYADCYWQYPFDNGCGTANTWTIITGSGNSDGTGDVIKIYRNAHGLDNHYYCRAEWHNGVPKGEITYPDALYYCDGQISEDAHWVVKLHGTDGFRIKQFGWGGKAPTVFSGDLVTGSPSGTCDGESYWDSFWMDCASGTCKAEFNGIAQNCASKDTLFDITFVE